MTDSSSTAHSPATPDPAQRWPDPESAPGEASRPRFRIFLADAFDWLRRAEPNSIHAVVTDPPYGLIEYTPQQLTKLRAGRGGVWRIPPSFDGHERRPLPRFTVLDDRARRDLEVFFTSLAVELRTALVPGAHVFIASNPLVSMAVIQGFLAGGFEKRGEIVRLIMTLRGGDRPKNAEDEFPDITVMPRSCWEPWLLFRKPLEGRVQDNLRKWGTGGLRRISASEPFKDVIPSGPARGEERQIAPHPTLKPQEFLRQLVRAALPLRRGVILDPFMGSGSTIAAAVACGLESVGLEVDEQYFLLAQAAIPRLTALVTPSDQTVLPL